MGETYIGHGILVSYDGEQVRISTTSREGTVWADVDGKVRHSILLSPDALREMVVWGQERGLLSEGVKA